MPLTLLWFGVTWDRRAGQMKTQHNYYQILHVQPDAPAEIIQSSYRTLMQRLSAHPDRGGDSSQAALINRAYAVLSNKRKRAQYDRELSRQLRVEINRAEKKAMGRTPEVAPEAGICPFCKHGHEYDREIPSNAFCSACKSPLFPAEHQRLEDSDQRKIARIGIQTKLRYYTHWPQLKAHSGVTADISKQGMMFKASQKIPLEHIVKLDCTQFQSIAIVLNCRQSGSILQREWQIGVKFLTLYFKSSRGVFITDIA
ncbi:MAG: J domain-containing protein [Pirellulales bacterium]|nr:J domain-containing protein [Pirellulales bacterium]